MNSTSLKGDFDKIKNNRNYFSILDREKIVANPNNYIKDKDIIDNIYPLNNQEFIQEYVLFNEIINADISANYNKFELKFNLINNKFANFKMIDVPQNVFIYVSDTNIYPLIIKKGSGDFSIKLSEETLT